jgi:CHAT domain-containing protein
MGSDTSIDHYLGIDVPLQEFSNPLPNEISRIVVERLKEEADRYCGINPHHSLDFAERIIKIGQVRQDTSQIALGWVARGNALMFIGQTDEAWEALEKAGNMFSQVGDEVGWARTRTSRLYLSPMLNCVAEALLEAEQAKQIFLRSGDQEKLLRLEIQMGYVYNHIGNKLEALQRFLAALKIAEELGEPGRPMLGILFTNLGSTVEGLGDLVQAKTYYERAYIIFSSEGAFLHLATVEANLGFLAHMQGHYNRALRLFTSSLEKAADHSELETSKIKWHMLESYQGLNRLIEACDLAREIVTDSRELKAALELALALLKLGEIEAEMGNLSEAKTSLVEAEMIFTSLNADNWTANTWLRWGTIAFKQGDANTAYHKAVEAANIFETEGQEVNYAAAALLKGRAALELVDLSTAESEAKKALRTAQLDNVASLRFAAHLLLGQIFEKKHVISRALRHYQAAAATTERVQRSLTITLSPGFLEDKMDAWRGLIRLHLQDGEVGKAFEILERSKSQVLFGYLANRENLLWSKDDPETCNLIEKLDRLRGEHQWFYKLAYEIPLSSDHSGHVETQQALMEVKSRERQIRAITEQLYLQSAEAEPANPTYLPSLNKIQESLDAETRVVEFYNNGRKVWAFIFDREAIEVHSLKITVQDINRLLAQLQMNLAAALRINVQDSAARNLTQHAKRILQRLYTALLEPLEHRLNRQQLVIVPYGALHYLPFNLMHDGVSYLIEKHEIVILPASGLLTQKAPGRKPGALILANSFEGRLNHTLEEGHIVHQLFGGRLYTEQSAERTTLNGEPVQILHIAAHGQYRLDQPDLSYIQLADGQLYADDLLQADLGYELVTLSACETGRANVSGGEELIGLGRGILYAGAGAIVLSLWPVPDKAAVMLMEKMYRCLKEGASKAAALQEAQLSIVNKNPELHPAFWGAFQLTGNPGPLSKQTV